ncbi:MAG: L-rhamnose isomerase [Clostridiales bacterium]|jgi:L-rhamnose isomerase|nr:L-rhamnose isomerase [Clostridiales bacterium]
MGERYDAAKEIYKKVGVDTDAAIKALAGVSISIHCWQGDDVGGFEGAKALSGGIQTTGNYPGKARNPDELMADIDKALSLLPGKHRLNLHASYAIFEDEIADRDALLPKHFKKWVDYAKERGLGLDFNPTYFSHDKADNATLSSEDEEIRAFWIRHGQASLRIAEYFANELGTPSTLDIWIPDGWKETPADRTGPRARLKDSLDQIIGIGYDKSKVYVTVESKVFGIGMESCTVGSHEFYMNYAAKNGIYCLLDNGHYHPTERVGDKIPSMLLFSDKVALHVTRAVRWDSDHVILLDDETKDIANEIVLAGLDKVILATDFFDASINRIAAWVVGVRSLQKALLLALLSPQEQLKKLQDERRLTELMVLREELKTFPVGDVWSEFCESQGVIPGFEWFSAVEEYEKEHLSLRK